MKGKNEAWLRDILFDHPEILPIEEIDSTFGPLVPLCKELRTDAGPIDAVFINERGRLTIVECKLWKNPEARREVVAQTLDYVGALSGWTYAELQAKVAVALHRQGNNPFELVRNHAGTPLREPEFIDAVSRSLREGRFLVLLAGDGIRQGVQSLTELVNRIATKAFTFGVVEVAIYKFGKNRTAIQPRVLATTETIIRQMTIVNAMAGAKPTYYEEVAGAADTKDEGARHTDKKHLRAWWQPVIKAKFDDPEQELPKWLVTNNIMLSTPYPGIQIKAWSTVDRSSMGVFLTGTAARLEAIEQMFKREKKYLLDNLPKGTIVDPKAGRPIILTNRDLVPDDAQRYAWLTKTLNEFANALRPRLRKWYEETRSD